MTIHIQSAMRYSGKQAFFRVAMVGVIASVAAGVYAPQAAQAQYAQSSKLVGVGGYGAPQQGAAVAVSGDGSTLIVGGPFATLSGPSVFVGSAWVFRRAGGSWSQEAILVGAAAPFDQTQQGFSVALSQDGDTALVGAPGDYFRRGEARVFTRTGGRWSEQAALYTPDGRLSFQGRSVDLSKDGNTAILGGYNDAAGVGAAWVFVRSGRAWNQQAKLLASDAVGGAYQGWSVSLADDGGAALVGGPSDNGGVGASWVFRRRNSGQWIQDGAKLVGSGASGFARQGTSVALSGPGDIAIVGGPDDGGGAGATWLFQRGRGVWRQTGAKLVGSGAVGAAKQGASVALSRDGATALVGGPGDNNSVGAAWSFTGWRGVWRQQGAKLVGKNAIGPAAQGQSVSLSGNGNIALVGGPQDNAQIGAAWVYNRSFAGAPRLASCYMQSVTALTTRFGGLNTAAWSLGYGMANVAPLESAIHAYCNDSADPAAEQAG
jgi:hypothetical protein